MTAPPYGDIGIINTLQATVDALQPRDLWFTKPSLDTFSDLITSMTQYRPSDRSSASEVLQHLWFQRRPDLIYTPGEVILNASLKSFL